MHSLDPMAVVWNEQKNKNVLSAAKLNHPIQKNKQMLLPLQCHAKNPNQMLPMLVVLLLAEILTSSAFFQHPFANHDLAYRQQQTVFHREPVGKAASRSMHCMPLFAELWVYVVSGITDAFLLTLQLFFLVRIHRFPL